MSILGVVIAFALGALGYWNLLNESYLASLLAFAVAASVLFTNYVRHRAMDSQREVEGDVSATRPGGSGRTAPVVTSRSIRTWRIIGICGLLASVAMVVVFPPASLVLAGLSVYSLHRMKKERVQL